jgi:hypothetical protein
MSADLPRVVIVQWTNDLGEDEVATTAVHGHADFGLAEWAEAFKAQNRNLLRKDRRRRRPVRVHRTGPGMTLTPIARTGVPMTTEQSRTREHVACVRAQAEVAAALEACDLILSRLKAVDRALPGLYHPSAGPT